MKLKAIVHEDQDGGYWAEVPALPGCATQGDTWDGLIANVHEAIEAWLDAGIDPVPSEPKSRVIEISV